MSNEDLKLAIQQMEEHGAREAVEEFPNIPISVTVITRNDPDGLRRCLESVKSVLLCDGDEICVLDTGSSPDISHKNKTVVESLGGNYHQRTLIKDIGPMVKAWLPEYYEVYEKSHLVEGSLLSFAEARDICSGLAKHPVQFWIDTDDTLKEERPGQLRWTVNRLFSEKGLNGRGADSLFLEYKYAFDKSDGSCITTLKRERIVDNSIYHWRGRCHETLIPRDDQWDKIRGAGFLQDLTTYIVHHKVNDDHKVTDIRNYIIMRNEIEECKKNRQPLDPRTIFYLGNACRGLGRDSEALEHYEALYEASGSLDDRWLAMYYSGMIWINDRNRRPLDALDCFYKCMRLRPNDRRTYFAISRCYYALARHAAALQFFRQGIQMPPLDVNLHADDPQHSELLPYQVAAMAARELGEHEFAKKCAGSMHEKYPNHQLTRAVVNILQNDEANSGLVDGVMRIVANEFGKSERPPGDAVKERVLYHLKGIKHIPDELEKQGFSPLEPERKIDPAKEVIFYCGQSVEPFGPRTTGLGGSERMVCAMAPELSRRGFQVSVYCNCPREDRGRDNDGVWWWHWGGMRTKQQRGTVIYWRSPELLELPIPALKRILWCHDVQNPKRWNEARAALADQVWVLSEYHKTTLGPWAEKLGDKVKITRNGVDTSAFATDPAPKRHCRKIIYASSPDRGVLSAIRTYQTAKQLHKSAMADTELHIYYGFTKLFLEHNASAEYRNIPDLGRDGSGWEYMQAVHKAVDNDPSIVWHGRVGWEEMTEAQRTAGVWIYPTRFPEISCMAAMEAQSAGCVVCASDYAALAETIDWSNETMAVKIDPDHLKSAAAGLAEAVSNAISLVGERTRLEHSKKAQERFSFEALGKEWELLINE